MPSSTTGTTVSCLLARLTADSFTENFGPTGLLDELLGTNKGYKSWLGELKRREVGQLAARAELVDK